MKKIQAILITISLAFSFVPYKAFAVKEVHRDENEIISYINMDWWQDFNDPTLTQYIIKALQCNHDLKIAGLKVEETTQNKNIKRADEMPSLGIGIIPALYKIPSAANSEGLLSLPLYASYEVDIFGKNRDKTKSLDKLVEISKQNERSVYISTASAVGTAYYNIVKLDKLIELQEKIIQDREQIYDLMKISNEEGLVSTADTVNANKALIKANSDITELKKARERMLNMLAVLTGDSPENSNEYERISFDDLIIKKRIPDYINSNIIEARPDYISAEKMLEKTGLDVRAAKKEFLPSFNIIGLLSFNTTEYLSKLNWANSAAVLGGGMLLPLFTGGKRIANLKLQKINMNKHWETTKRQI